MVNTERELSHEKIKVSLNDIHDVYFIVGGVL
jgi:hypothetical protein